MILSEPIGAHLPWGRADEFLDLLLELGLTAEIAFKGPDFDHLDAAAVGRLTRRLQQAGRRPTVHAPFFDLNPGALDPLIREVTRHRLEQTLTVAETLHARLIVVHPGVDDWRYPGLQQEWLRLAVDVLRPLVARAAAGQYHIAVENIYERTPTSLCALVDTLDSPWFGHCFDIGHWRLFAATPMDVWLDALGERLLHLHLHDNHGSADEHLPIGAGRIDFDLFCRLLQRTPARPSVTLEAHSPEHLLISLRHLRDRLA
ncbi:MAG: sugar phosphate isomerase/epimerase family protein [Desulfuromonadales bacterium]|nr:sugar phosphate isomerase/epimerase family protein [Desulfuromonadales bacterium]